MRMKIPTLLQFPFLILLSLLAFLPTLSAQTGEVRGTVFDKEKGEAMIFTPVAVSGTTKGAITDQNGFYTLKLAPGTYTLIATSLGYDSMKATITIVEDKIITQNFYINTSSIQVGEVKITKNRTMKDSRVEISKTVITPKQVQVMPSIGSEGDIAQYLQLLPGVVFTGDQGGQLYMRGGAPIQNKVLLDGMTIYNPFHSIGLFSVFDVDIIRNADVYTAGFDAQYGDRTSAVMDITTREGNMKRFAGQVNVSPFTSKLLLEGPLKKFEENKGGSSVLFSARTSYLKETSPILYSYAGQDGLPYDFLDLYGKISFLGDEGSKASFFGFSFNDKTDFKEKSYFNWSSYGVGSKISLIPASSTTVIELNFAYSDYKAEQKDADQLPRSSEINGFEAGVNFTYSEGKDQLKYGFQINGFKTNFLIYNTARRKIEQQDFTTEFAGFVKYNKVFNRLILDPSFRLQYYASLQEPSFEPRFGAKYILTDKLRLKGAVGLYSQNLISAESDRDVVNLFYGFLSTPDDLYLNDGTKPDSYLQKSRHVVVGIEKDFGKYITFQVEGYIKDFNQLININQNKLFDFSPEFINIPLSLKQDFVVEDGLAKGLDFLFSYDRKPYYVWITYSLAKVTRNSGDNTYFPHWDRRHTVNVLTAIQFGKNNSWETSLRWSLGSAFPFTKTKGFYELLDFQDGVQTDYTTANGDLAIRYSNYNGGRLSDYHRLDFSIKKHIELKKHSSMNINFSVTNVYDRKNIFYFDRVNYTRVNQLPILPSIGINYTF